MTRFSIPLIGFFSIVALFTGLDMAMVIAMVWSSMKVTGSTLTLGLVLCISTAAPFALEQWARHRGRARPPNLARLMLIRIGGFALVWLGAGAGMSGLLTGFIAMALVVGMLDYFTVSTLEAHNTGLVLAGRCSSEQAARAMQTAVQIGAFAGAFLGGWALDRWDMPQVLSWVSALAAVSALALITLPRPVRAAAGTAAPGAPAAVRQPGLPPGAWMVLWSLGMVGFHIGAFNSLVPIVFHQLRDWTASDFGMVSGLAGIGAFLAAVLPLSRWPWPLFLLATLLADAAIVLGHAVDMALAGAFVLGFSINFLRIRFRRVLIELANDQDAADRLAARSAFFYLMLQAAAPLLLATLTSSSLWGSRSAPALMLLTALGLLAVSAGSVATRTPHPTHPEPLKDVS